MPISSPPAGDEFATQRTARPGTVGVPIASSLAVVDRTSLAPLPYGVPGAIAICGLVCSRGTSTPPTIATPSSSERRRLAVPQWGDGDGDDGARWFMTGDVGVLDGGGSGSLTITGRAKELIKRGGEQVSPYEVEAAVRGHESVVFAVAFAVPSAVWGEEVGVAIVLEDDTGPAATKELTLSNRTLLREMRDAHACGLAAHKIPSRRSSSIRRSCKDANGEGDPASGGHLGVTTVAPEVARPDHRASRRHWPACASCRGASSASVGISEGASGGMWGAVGCAAARTRAHLLRARCLQPARRWPAALESRLVAARLAPCTRCTSHPPAPPRHAADQYNPTNFDDEFHWEAQPTDTLRGDFCEPAAGLSTWGGFVSTIAITALDAELAAASLRVAALVLTWFSSVYYALLCTQPFLYSRLAALRGEKGALLALLLLLVALNSASPPASTPASPSPRRRRPDAPWANWFTLGTTSSRRFGGPAAMGATAAFLFDAHRRLAPRAPVGVLCDVISVELLLQIVATVVFSTCEKHGTFARRATRGRRRWGSGRGSASARTTASASVRSPPSCRGCMLN